jgi:hypothetical protein
VPGRGVVRSRSHDWALPLLAPPGFPKEPARFHNWRMMPRPARNAQAGFMDYLRVISREHSQRSPWQSLAMVRGRFLACSSIGFSPFTGLAQRAFHLGIHSRWKLHRPGLLKDL